MTQSEGNKNVPKTISWIIFNILGDTKNGIPLRVCLRLDCTFFC